MPVKSKQQPDVSVTALQPEPDVFTVEQIAVKLHQTVEWVESKCRRRCPYPIPFHNIGNHRLFVWSEVFAWVVNAPQVVHSSHAELHLRKEQSFQDSYCVANGLPIRPQARRGIDYYDQLCGFIEFTTGGKVENKDISSYVQQANGESYKIVFVDGVPPNRELAEALVKLNIGWEVFTPQAVAA